ncbi:MAG TPA: PIN domain-containing protein [Mycobacterium sp.]|nr:PIN domain-containing protein [Mycobacterium sp.]
MGSTVIVLDTNQFFLSPMLRSSDLAELLAKAPEWDLRFVVPEVCLLEAIDVVRRKWHAQRSVIAKLSVGEFGLSESQREWLEAIDTSIDGYDVAIRGRLTEIGAEVVPIPARVHLLDIVRRAINRRRPFPDGEGKKDGFRDTLIWHTVEGIAGESNDCDVWLISTNHNDFGDKAAADNDETCPYPLHPHLLEDLKGHNLIGRISYVRTLGRLAQHLASTYDGLPEDEREVLTSDLDSEEFQLQLGVALDQIRIDPADAALPLRTALATIQSIENKPGPPQFDDVAMRGAGSWTAQFTQTIAATIDLTSTGGDTSLIAKMLDVTGRLHASADDGSVKQVIVTSVDARPDDPMRRAWNRPQQLRLDSEMLQGFRDDRRLGLDPESLKGFRESLNLGLDPETLKGFRESLNLGLDPETLKGFRESLNLGLDPETLKGIQENMRLGVDPELLQGFSSSIGSPATEEDSDSDPPDRDQPDSDEPDSDDRDN